MNIESKYCQRAILLFLFYSFYFVALAQTPSYSSSHKYYVSPHGVDTNGGSETEPFKTLNHAFKQLGAGDTLFMMKGSYHEEGLISTKKGTKSNPIVITNYQSDLVTIEGAVPVTTLSNTGWIHDKGDIYKIKLEEDIWQLFYKGEWTMLARWPNASFANNYAWDRSLWCQGVESKSLIQTNASGDLEGVEYDDPITGHDLSSLKFDATGAMAVLNVFNFSTYARKVTKHNAGDDFFFYDAKSVRLKPVFHYYFFDSKYEFIDEAGEWYYDPNSQYLYLWSPTGGVPSDVTVRNIDKGIFIKRCDYVKFDGIYFHASGVEVEKSNYVSFENCEFLYPCFNKRTLGKTGAETGLFFRNCKNSSVVNSTLAYTDGLVVKFDKGEYNTVDNCLLHDLDYTVAHHSGNSGFLWFRSCPYSTFRRNEVYRTGASEGVMISGNSMVELNKIHDIHPLQHDGAMVHLFMGANDCTISNNWFYNNSKPSIRMQDGPRDVLNPDQGPGLVHHNVSFNTLSTSFMLKGDYKRVFNNISMNKIVFADKSRDPNSPIHNNSQSANNATQEEVSFKAGKHENNWIGDDLGETLTEQVFDWNNFDFRPRLESSFINTGKKIALKYKGSSPDIGAYEYEDTYYWIPGRKLSKTSNPIPADNATTIYNKVDLIWLQAYKSIDSEVYFGDAYDIVTTATKSSDTFKGRQSNNIYHPYSLVKGKRYYWRVDAVQNGKTMKGDTWTFIAGQDANVSKNRLTITLKGTDGTKEWPLEDANVMIKNKRGVTNSEGVFRIDPLENDLYKVEVSKIGYTPKTVYVNLQKDFVLNEMLLIEGSTTMVDSNNRSFKIYPNPAKDVVTISGSNVIEQYQIFNTNGCLVKQKQTSKNKVRIDISELPSGTYVIQFKVKNSVINKTLIKS
ncbi:right-handed parallel beta-helix repeat-containing protein [Halosquirtibacter laminarini]|uniref:Right-handed parallel beta-helix repeat-containing protein n=1 Tax=Halosquirtibacter laminarini TaxID=3374600 RepID=A0AC61NFS4_9BACT|nr:right-handed parallel beta-helix repeat-containing protein [Prolixibacteraceae bacterium]